MESAINLYYLEKQGPFSNFHSMSQQHPWPDCGLVFNFGLVLALITVYDLKPPVPFLSWPLCPLSILFTYCIHLDKPSEPVLIIYDVVSTACLFIPKCRNHSDDQVLNYLLPSCHFAEEWQALHPLEVSLFSYSCKKAYVILQKLPL